VEFAFNCRGWLLIAQRFEHDWGGDGHKAYQETALNGLPRTPGGTAVEDVVMVGGGPSGLAAAHETVSRGAKAIVLERLNCLGGLSRTTEFEGARFDVGPHRFFTKNQEVLTLFIRMAAEDLVSVPPLRCCLSAGPRPAIF
jgi:hypothetical protein